MVDYSNLNTGSGRKMINVMELFGFDNRGNIIEYPWDLTTSNISWQSGQTYDSDFVVSYGGELFKALDYHTSIPATPPMDSDGAVSSQWQLLTDDDLEWRENLGYSKWQFVSRQGKLYYAKQDHVSSANDEPALSNNNWKDYWIQFLSLNDGNVRPLEFDQTGVIPYAPGDIVSYDGDLYVSKTTQLNDGATRPLPNGDTTNWNILDDLAWDVAKTYQSGQFVSYQNDLYFSTADDFVQSATTNPAQDIVDNGLNSTWKKYAPTAGVARASIIWQAGGNYDQGDFVSHNGNLYYATGATNSNINPLKTPGQDIADGGQFWELFTPFSKIKWDPTYNYDSYDFVSYNENIYYLDPTVAVPYSSVVDPATDDNWIKYVPDSKNAEKATNADHANTADTATHVENVLEWESGQNYQYQEFVSYDGKLYYLTKNDSDFSTNPVRRYANTISPLLDPLWTEYSSGTGGGGSGFETYAFTAPALIGDPNNLIVGWQGTHTVSYTATEDPANFVHVVWHGGVRMEAADWIVAITPGVGIWTVDIIINGPLPQGSAIDVDVHKVSVAGD